MITRGAWCRGRARGGRDLACGVGELGVQQALAGRGVGREPSDAPCPAELGEQSVDDAGMYAADEVGTLAGLVGEGAPVESNAYTVGEAIAVGRCRVRRNRVSAGCRSPRTV